VAFRPAGATYDEVFDPQAVRDSHPKDQQPARRRYTVRGWDPAAARLTVDFVVHGDSGVAGPWAAAARPGDVLVFTGPSGSYRPDPQADWHLMVGDESALPAIAASLDALPAGTRAVVRVVCDGPDHEIELTSTADVDLVWLHRRGDPRDESLLVAAVEALDFTALGSGTGTPFGFVHGEADEIRAVRRHLLEERGLTRRQLSCSPYWRRTMTDEAWRQIKRDYVAAMEADAAAS
jgi:NADPH-dependent ferric siderophore reductase